MRRLERERSNASGQAAPASTSTPVSQRTSLPPVADEPTIGVDADRRPVFRVTCGCAARPRRKHRLPRWPVSLRTANWAGFRRLAAVDHHRAKAPTEYRLVRDASTTRCPARHADAAASGLRQLLDIDPREHPLVEWRWRVVDLIISADNQTVRGGLAVRLMLFFDGDRSACTEGKALMETVNCSPASNCVRDTDVHLGKPVPGGYVLANSYTSQVKLIVAGSGRMRDSDSGSSSSATT